MAGPRSGWSTSESSASASRPCAFAKVLPEFPWTDSSLVAGATPVRRVHLTELRAALDAVYDALARPRPNYTDAVVRAGATPVKAAHVIELRGAVLELEAFRLE